MHRKINSEQNLAFGYGDNRCIAEGLSKAELMAALCELIFISFGFSVLMCLSLLVPEIAEFRAWSAG